MIAYTSEQPDGGIRHRRIAANRLEYIVKSVREAREEYREGKCVASTADEIMADILS